ncbi:hypothetical protein SARI_04492 [Salmonella enterica subsp. arizonae serovar 62:z4,z23:-]|uniref:Uncharacterized protein n=1 Tax=Salmonella arizonae (strain ATCC BAA-731 / CDC346-86 / RSK2980) TaxID=41514 RepID=A9MQM3_SALAR|nr:hypothetical protein SARI_04492 [Salmonella enterica subsp. arizonae serovar 62:z4,z23:-]
MVCQFYLFDLCQFLLGKIRSPFNLKWVDVFISKILMARVAARF